TTTLYDYRNGRMRALGGSVPKVSLGFQTVTVTDQDTKTATTTSYSQIIPLHNRPLVVERMDVSPLDLPQPGPPVTLTKDSYTYVHGGTAPFVNVHMLSLLNMVYSGGAPVHGLLTDNMESDDVNNLTYSESCATGANGACSEERTVLEQEFVDK